MKETVSVSIRSFVLIRPRSQCDNHKEGVDLFGGHKEMKEVTKAIISPLADIYSSCTNLINSYIE